MRLSKKAREYILDFYSIDFSGGWLLEEYKKRLSHMKESKDFFHQRQRAKIAELQEQIDFYKKQTAEFRIIEKEIEDFYTGPNKEDILEKLRPSIEGEEIFINCCQKEIDSYLAADPEEEYQKELEELKAKIARYERLGNNVQERKKLAKESFKS